MKRKREILDLDALAVIRDAVSVAGKEYEIKAASDLSPNDLAFLTRLSEEAQELRSSDWTEESADALMRNLRQQLGVIFYSEIPDNVVDNLSLGQVQRLVDFFIERAELESEAMADRLSQARPRSAKSTGGA